MRNYLNYFFYASISAPPAAGYDLKYLQRTIATPLELARKRFPRPNLEDLNESLDVSISFLVVREPFERIVSAYRNKFEHGKNTYYKLLGDQIVKKFRSMTTNRVSRIDAEDLSSCAIRFSFISFSTDRIRPLVQHFPSFFSSWCITTSPADVSTSTGVPYISSVRLVASTLL